MNLILLQMKHTKDYQCMILLMRLKNMQKKTVIILYLVLRKLITCYLCSLSRIVPHHHCLLVKHYHRLPLLPLDPPLLLFQHLQIIKSYHPG